MAYLIKMTSQKRYRHHHDNNAASRFRDLPPRFKRQKSSSSPKPTPVESNLMNQENEKFSSPSPSNSPPLSQNTILTCNASLDTPMKQPFRIFNSQSPPPSLLQGQVPKDAPLSVNTVGFVDYSFPMTEVYSNNQYLQPHNYLTPPLSPWAMQNGQCDAMKSLPGSELAVYPQNSRTSPDILAPALEMATASPESPWMRHSPILHQDRLHTASPIHPEALSKPSQMHNVRVKPVDFSDPDIRTIEMLRELERVADQKEKEDEADAGTDRKNLVSHHLRMLMCAVDRYTADIDEETPSADDSKNDRSFATTQCAGNESSNQWQNQGRKQRISNSHSQNKHEQPQERKFSNHVVKDNTKMSGLGSSKQQTNSATQQWANPQQTNHSNSIYNSSWQMTKPPKSQTPPNLISSHAASVQMNSQAPLPHSKSMPTLNKPSPSQVLHTPQVSHFNTSPPINQPCYTSRPMTSYPYQAHSGHQTPQDAFAHLWSSQVFDASTVSEYQRKGWDIWSGPSFNNIYSQELCNQGSRNATELEQDFLFYVNGSTSDRKPLYKR